MQNWTIALTVMPYAYYLELAQSAWMICLHAVNVSTAANAYILSLIGSSNSGQSVHLSLTISTIECSG